MKAAIIALVITFSTSELLAQQLLNVKKEMDRLDWEELMRNLGSGFCGAVAFMAEKPGCRALDLEKSINCIYEQIDNAIKENDSEIPPVKKRNIVRKAAVELASILRSRGLRFKDQLLDYLDRVARETEPADLENQVHLLSDIVEVPGIKEKLPVWLDKAESLVKEIPNPISRANMLANISIARGYGQFASELFSPALIGLDPYGKVDVKAGQEGLANAIERIRAQLDAYLLFYDTREYRADRGSQYNAYSEQGRTFYGLPPEYSIETQYSKITNGKWFLRSDPRFTFTREQWETLVPATKVPGFTYRLSPEALITLLEAGDLYIVTDDGPSPFSSYYKAQKLFQDLALGDKTEFFKVLLGVAHTSMQTMLERLSVARALYTYSKRYTETGNNDSFAAWESRALDTIDFDKRAFHLVINHFAPIETVLPDRARWVTLGRFAAKTLGDTEFAAKATQSIENQASQTDMLIKLFYDELREHNPYMTHGYADIVPKEKEIAGMIDNFGSLYYSVTRFLYFNQKLLAEKIDENTKYPKQVYANIQGGVQSLLVQQLAIECYYYRLRDMIYSGQTCPLQVTKAQWSDGPYGVRSRTCPIRMSIRDAVTVRGLSRHAGFCPKNGYDYAREKIDHAILARLGELDEKAIWTAFNFDLVDKGSDLLFLLMTAGIGNVFQKAAKFGVKQLAGLTSKQLLIATAKQVVQKGPGVMRYLAMGSFFTTALKIKGLGLGRPFFDPNLTITQNMESFAVESIFAGGLFAGMDQFSRFVTLARFSRAAASTGVVSKEALKASALRGGLYQFIFDVAADATFLTFAHQLSKELHVHMAAKFSGTNYEAAMKWFEATYSSDGEILNSLFVALLFRTVHFHTTRDGLRATFFIEGVSKPKS